MSGSWLAEQERKAVQVEGTQNAQKSAAAGRRHCCESEKVNTGGAETKEKHCETRLQDLARAWPHRTLQNSFCLQFNYYRKSKDSWAWGHEGETVMTKFEKIILSRVGRTKIGQAVSEEKKPTRKRLLYAAKGGKGSPGKVV